MLDLLLREGQRLRLLEVKQLRGVFTDHRELTGDELVGGFLASLDHRVDMRDDLAGGLVERHGLGEADGGEDRRALVGGGGGELLLDGRALRPRHDRDGRSHRRLGERHGVEAGDVDVGHVLRGVEGEPGGRHPAVLGREVVQRAEAQRAGRRAAAARPLPAGRLVGVLARPAGPRQELEVGTLVAVGRGECCHEHTLPVVPRQVRVRDVRQSLTDRLRRGRGCFM